MKKNGEQGLPDFGEASVDVISGGLPALEMETEKYLPELDGLDITEAQKRELLEILASIMRSFVELGFSTDICGQIFGAFNEVAEGDPVEVASSHQSTTEKQSKSGKDGDA